MNTTIDERLTKESIALLDRCHSNVQTDNVFETFLSDHRHVNECICSVSDKYIAISNPELEGDELISYKEDLRLDISKFIESSEVLPEDADSLENITRIAFSRLANVSKSCYFGKLSDSASEKLNELNLKAEKVRQEYESIMRIN